MGESEYKVYVAGIVSQLREQFHDASFMVFNFREGEQQSQIANILSEFDMTVMDYPRHYEGCPLLTMEMIHHFLRSSESWLSLDQQNVLLMHCERGGWCVLAFMLAALLIYRKQFTGEQKTLDMIYKQAPHELVNLLSPLNPMPSQMRYLQYVSRRNVGSEWPPLDRTLTLDCVILRTIPSFDGEGGCRPIFRIYGQDPFMASDRTTKVLFSTPKRSKTVKLYRQADCELVKIDINCRILGDVVLECISLDEDLDREEMMFRVMFNTAFIRSNILMLNRDEIDILWDAKNRFSKDFRAEVLLSEMNAASSVITVDLVSSGDKDGLPEEAFAKVQEFFNTVDWLDPKADAALHALQQITSSNIHQEKLDVVSPEKIDIYRSPPPSPHIVLQGPSQPKADAALHALQQITSSNIHLENLDVVSPEKIDIYRSPPPSPHIVLQGPSQPKVVFESSSQTVGITSVLHDHDEYESSEATQYVKNSSYTESKAASPRPPLTPSSFLAKSVPSTPPPPPPPPPPRSGHLLSSSSPPPPPSTPLAAARIPMLQSLTPITPPVEERAKSPPSPTLLASSSPMKKSTPPPPPPPPPINKSCPPPPPPPPPATSSAPQPPPMKKSVLPPPPPPPRPGRTPSAPPPPPPPQNLSTHSNGSKGIGHGAIPPPPPNVQKVGPPPLPNGLKTTPASLGVKGRTNTRSSTHSPKKTSLKPLHWVKVTRAMQGSLWAETQKSDDASKPPEFDMSELESLFSAAVPNSELRGSADKSRGRSSTGHKPEKVHLIDLRRANNCEIMLTKVKMPLPDLMSTVLALDDSLLDADQVDNLIKFCPTKEEMDLLKGFSGNKELLGKCEQYFLELMKVPRVESKLRVFSFKIQFQAQVADLSGNLNTVNSASSEIRNSAKLKRIMQTILSLGNALNQGTARGSAIGFRLDSLLKLTDTRARNNKMTLMHYLCKVVADKLPELLDFPKDLVSLEPASKIQLKTLAEEMQAISKGLEKVEEELTASENDGPVSDMFRKTLKEFLKVAEGEVRSLASLYSNVGRNADALALYFGEDPARCPFEQVISTLLNFVRMFVRAHDENCKQLELEKKKAEKEAETERIKLNAQRKEPELLRSQSRGTRSR